MSTHALIIPFRNREEHLSILLDYLETKYQHGLDIIVMEQFDNCPFNRGHMFNVVLDIEPKYDYYIFHDVDLVPESEDINYLQEFPIPTHLSCYCEQFNYKLLDNKPWQDSQMFGGVIAMSRAHFELIDGYCDRYVGWGYEDNDLLRRVFKKIKNIDRKPWIYKSLNHTRDHETHSNIIHNKVLYDKNITYKRSKTNIIGIKQDRVLRYQIDTEHMYIPKICSQDLYRIFKAYNEKQNVLIDNDGTDCYDIRKWTEFYNKSYHITNEKLFLYHKDIIKQMLSNERPHKYIRNMTINKFPVYCKTSDKFINTISRFKSISCSHITSCSQTLDNNLRIMATYYELNCDLWIFDFFKDYEFLTGHFMNNRLSENRPFENTDLLTVTNINWFLYDNFENKFHKFIKNKKKFIDEERIHLLKIDFPKHEYTSSNTILFVSHPGGGGVEKHLNMMTDHCNKYVILKPNSHKLNLLELEINGNTEFFHEANILPLWYKLISLGISHIVINHLCIFSNQVLIMLRCFKWYKVPSITICHDLMYLHPNTNDKRVRKERNCFYIKNRLDTIDNGLPLICPSEYLSKKYAKYTKLKTKTLSINWSQNYAINSKEHNGNVRIVVLGMFKGDKEMENFLNKTNYTIDFFGQTKTRHERLINHGSYNDDNIVSLIKEIDPTFIWFPSRQPETFCYALTYAMDSGYPIIAYKCGAIEERLKDKPLMTLMNYNNTLDQNIDTILISLNINQTIHYNEYGRISSQEYMKTLLSYMSKDYKKLLKEYY